VLSPAVAGIHPTLYACRSDGRRWSRDGISKPNFSLENEEKEENKSGLRKIEELNSAGLA
jgi:hypothetical protein